ncbi:Tfp pilus assembly protein, tip-associated adhesin PilY1 [Serpentinimonas maccroryi]|uniref:Tfp pilus assembly protein, tip-associated adhesin PilY1 n=1 Tax=Serpentinimonas maccroryi TaxID=1458426 RepID=A0A060NMS8_9BURK|nr:PilC/PilY family type IV pilus protein [Serpentinimonas maccroryi]BAO82690.1 Tfp pilus assembly protein, tip-associated adhesin PilY1 [Serpentinimonas maccroryi]
MPHLARSLSALHWPTAARRWLRYCALLLALGAAGASLLLGPMAAANSPGALGANPETSPPLAVAQGAPPLVMLTMARDHTLFYEAYNDASDINGDGRLDTRFDPNIIYLGLFDSRLCYAYTPGTTGADARRNDNAGIFRPAARAVAAPGTNTNLSCATASHWSGNWLNWATTSRIDALRVVLYGGYRETDTATSTVLRRAYIPQDAHSWAKEYTSVTVDGYDISAFTPLSQPSGSGIRRHFFGNLTDVHGRNCATLNDCSNRAPLLRVVTNARDARVWQWATTERPVLHESNNQFGGARTDHTVRVEVCTAAFNDGCKRYPSGALKPVGLLHEFGENGSMLFGLLTGSYDRNLSGGVLRKVVSSFANEVNPSNGTFTANATLVNTIDALRIRGFNDGRTDNAYRTGWVTTRPMAQGEFVDWGNPVAEMMYEGLRYFAGRGGATSAFATSGGVDGHLGLPVATWDDPFNPLAGAARARWCARPNQLVISGVNPSFDSDQLPGSAFGSLSGDLSGLHVANIGQTIADHEPGIKGSRFIGQVGTTFDGAPTAKEVTSLGNIRGLSPEGPTQQGSFYSASVAKFGRTTDLRPALQGQQTVDTHVVALSSPLPTITMTTPGGHTFSLVPFAKSVGGSGISNARGAFQPTNQIVDFYVETIGPNLARFRINFEDVEQGADHDMDAIVTYEISLQADGQLRVVLIPEFQAGGIQHSFGYVLSGSTADGVYLVVQDEALDRPYHLNVPPGRSPGFCATTPFPAGCGTLPRLGGGAGNDRSIRLFTASTTPAASVLPSPLWLAAKWGGFTDLNNNQRPDLQAEWDVNRDGVPDTYHLVQNPTLLRDQLARAFTTILERNAAAGNVSANSTFITTDSAVFQATFNSANWSGDLQSFPVTAADGVSQVPLWRASERLPGFASRRLFTTNAANSPATVPFVWSALSADQRALFGVDRDAQERVINHLRGDPSNEVRNPHGTLRNRPTTVLGDIIHSSPVYVGDNNTVFVGSNSGFLHAFNARTGVERFAFAPSSLLEHMPRLSDPNYVRRYFVDGELAVSQRANTGGRNILIGFLGRGGRGLFALDVTDAANFGADGNASRALWEAYGASDPDKGYLLGRPMIAKVQGPGTVPIDVVIFGNGYNSTSGRAVLYVKNLRTGALISKIDTEVGSATSPNGLASPGLALDANGVVQHVYAGDLQGNVWKFDLAHQNPNQWRSSFGSADTPAPFFVATNAAGVRQPITAPITVATNNAPNDPHVGKRFVFFGTGSYMRATDPADRQVQSIYALIDEGVQITGRTALRQRSINQVGTFAGRPVRTFSVASAGDMENRQGWFLDWVEPPPGSARGERVVSAARIIPAAVPALVVSSIIPVTDDPCVPGGTGFLNLLNPFSGGSITAGLLDVSRDNRFSDDLLGTQFIASFDPGIGLLSEAVLVGSRLVVGGSEARVADVGVAIREDPVDPPGGPGVNAEDDPRGRISWREIIR